MNVFEDLIEELRDENLIETTIFEAGSDPGTSSSDLSKHQEKADDAEYSKDDDQDDEIVEELSPFERDKKIAMEEVSSLQMVGHILSAIEREYLKEPASNGDNLEVKKALHAFVQMADDVDSVAYSEARGELLRETESWYSALAERDSNISVADLRLFCENSKPVLSSQALISLARFYRNAPFSEHVRSKFDYVITRLFSRDAGDAKRKLLFGRIEMIGHLSTLYSNWSSLSIYDSEEYSGIVREQTSLFGELAAEVEACGSLDQLLNADLFDRLRNNKEVLADMFFACDITAASIDCNLRLGNKFIDLVHAEGEIASLERIEEKYGYTYDQVVSDAAGRTIQLIEILKNAPDPEAGDTDNSDQSTGKVEFERAPVVESSRRFTSLRANKWLIAATILTAIISVGLYLWAGQYESSQTMAVQAANFDFTGSGLEKYLKSGRRTSETVYGVTMPDWDLLSEREQKQILTDTLKFVNGKGVKKIQLSNSKGRTIAFASEGRQDLYPQ